MWKSRQWRLRRVVEKAASPRHASRRERVDGAAGRREDSARTHPRRPRPVPHDGWSACGGSREVQEKAVDTRRPRRRRGAAPTGRSPRAGGIGVRPQSKTRQRESAHRAEETAFTALEAKTPLEQRASDEGTATQGLRVKLEGMEADREKCKAEMEKLAAELEQVSAEKDAAVAHQKELQDALDAANKQLKKEAIVIASKDEFIKTLIQTPAAA